MQTLNNNIPFQQTYKQSPFYFPGKLLVLINEYFNLQKQIKSEGNQINKWKEYVQRFFSPKCIYCNIMNRDNKDWACSK
jgi:hypothetical protein